PRPRWARRAPTHRKVDHGSIRPRVKLVAGAEPIADRPVRHPGCGKIASVSRGCEPDRAPPKAGRPRGRGIRGAGLCSGARGPTAGPTARSFLFYLGANSLLS